MNWRGAIRHGPLWPWALLLSIGALGWLNGLGSQDRLLMDQVQRLNTRSPSPDIVIVAIDDRSIDELGRWPWPRSVHAQLLDRLRTMQARAVGMDILMSEPERRNDAVLAEALRRNGNVVLPLRMAQLNQQEPMASLPAPELRAAAHGVGHVHIELDTDGIVRSLYLREGVAGQWWDHWTLALLSAAGRPLDPSHWPGQPRSFDGAPSGVWLRNWFMQIPYAGPPGTFARVPYVDVLDGNLPEGAMRGKIVLVGATAGGLGDAYPTPATSQDGIMPGVEISANVLDALMRGVTLRRAQPWENALFSVFAIGLALAALLRLRSTAAAISIAVLLLAVMAAAVLAIRILGIQFAPAAALLGVLASYPLWSWRRLQRAMGYLSEEFERTRRTGEELLLPTQENRDFAPPDELEARIHAMSNAAEQLRNLKRFVRESIDTLPDPTLVTDAQGVVLLANRSANRAFGMEFPLLGAPLSSVLSRHLRGPAGEPLLDFADLWPTMEASPSHPSTRELEVTDSTRREQLLKAVERQGDSDQSSGWIVSVVDVSIVLQAQRQREESMRFLSHDLRAPLSAILTLLELERRDPSESATLRPRIAKHATNALRLADDFVQLARAQSEAYLFAEANLADVLFDAQEQCWARARARSVRLEPVVPDTPCYGWIDRSLLTRALVNLIDNAIKYGPERASVHCTLMFEKDWACLEVADQGEAIPPEQQARLFRPFGRLDQPGPDPGGAGLGLMFVQTVVVRHQGSVELQSEPGMGTRVRLRIPRYEPQDE